jgi:molybdopterin-binding protein
LNIFSGKVIELRPSGEAAVEVDIDCNGLRVAARLTRKSVETLGLIAGMPVYAILKGVTMDKTTLAKSPLSANLHGTDLGARLQEEASSGGGCRQTSIRKGTTDRSG